MPLTPQLAFRAEPPTQVLTHTQLQKLGCWTSLSTTYFPVGPPST